MRPGARRYVIRIEKRTDTVNAVGQSIPTWSVFSASVPASYDPKAGREFFAASGAVFMEAAMFSIAYRKGVVPEMRVKFDGKIWDVSNVENVGGRNMDMQLYCATGLNTG